MAQECLFFGALFLTWIYCRCWNITRFLMRAARKRRSGSAVSIPKSCSPAALPASALLFIRAGGERGMTILLGVVASFGIAFLCLKGYEWHLDFDEHTWVLDPISR